MAFAGVWTSKNHVFIVRWPWCIVVGLWLCVVRGKRMPCEMHYCCRIRWCKIQVRVEQTVAFMMVKWNLPHQYPKRWLVIVDPCLNWAHSCRYVLLCCCLCRWCCAILVSSNDRPVDGRTGWHCTKNWKPETNKHNKHNKHNNKTPHPSSPAPTNWTHISPKEQAVALCTLVSTLPFHFISFNSIALCIGTSLQRTNEALIDTSNTTKGHPPQPSLSHHVWSASSSRTTDHWKK